MSDYIHIQHLTPSLLTETFSAFIPFSFESPAHVKILCWSKRLQGYYFGFIAFFVGSIPICGCHLKNKSLDKSLERNRRGDVNIFRVILYLTHHPDHPDPDLPISFQRMEILSLSFSYAECGAADLTVGQLCRPTPACNCMDWFQLSQ